MKWEDFKRIYMKDLYCLWLDRIPLKEGTVVSTEVKRYTVYIQDEEKFYDFYDNGTRVTGLMDFVYCAYENSIP